MSDGAEPGSTDKSDEKRRTRAETRWPAAIAIVIALVLYATLPSQFPIILRAVVVGLCLALLIPIMIASPRRLDKQSRSSRVASLALALVLVVANQIALVILIVILVTAKGSSGPAALLASVQVWVTNIIAIGTLFWELDRGGPVTRRVDPRRSLPAADFRFPQDEDADTVVEVATRSSEKSDWMPGFVDYLYLSMTNSTAYSPTDVMPLSPRAKMLMGFQGTVSFVIVALVIARAVSLLG